MVEGITLDGFFQTCPHCGHSVLNKVRAGVTSVDRTQKSVSYALEILCPACKTLIARINHIATRETDRLEVK